MVQNAKKKHYYVERDVSQMYFNHHVLREAQKPTVPLLRCLSFLGIYSNNPDGFFRVRMASLNKILESTKVSAATAKMIKKTIKHINKLNEGYNIEYGNAIKSVFVGLGKHSIQMLDETQLNEEQKAFLKIFYYDKPNGSTNPIWFSETDDVSILEGNRTYLAVKRTEEVSRKTRFAIIKIPDRIYRRFLKIPSSDNCENFMYLNDVVRHCLPLIFIGLKKYTYEAYFFKFIKDVEMKVDNEADCGAMGRIAIGANSRKRGEAIRVVYDKDVSADLKKKVMKCLHAKKFDTLLAAGRYQSHKNSMGFPVPGHKKLSYPKWPQILRPESLSEGSIFDLIRQKDRLIHTPYHSFNGYIRILREAALRPEVKEMKTTLYRLAKGSKVVKASIYVAQDGKRVTTVVELLVRFDEESNIGWNKRMQKEGMNVTFDVEGLKTHSEPLYTMTTKGDLTCAGTGNFHEGNAKTCIDYPMMTARPRIVSEAEKVFYFIDRPFSQARFREPMVSSGSMKAHIIRMFNNEIKNVLAGEGTQVKIRTNHVIDPDIVNKLYAASQAGAKIDLLLCGDYSLVPGVKGVSENIKVVGTIDRYLGYSRIPIFCNGGKPKYYLESTDWMPCNLINRAGVMIPVYNQGLQQDLLRTVEYGMHDTTNGRLIDGLETNKIQPIAEGELPFRSQQTLFEAYQTEQQA